MRRVGSALLLLVAGCAEAEEQASGPDAEQLEQIAVARPERVDRHASVRLQPLGSPDVGEGVACYFHSGEQVFLAASADDSVVRIAGNLRHLLPSAPVGPSGGFFEDRGISVSIGRERGEGERDGRGRWPARIIVTNRRTGVEQRGIGSWTCRS